VIGGGAVVAVSWYPGVGSFGRGAKSEESAVGDGRAAATVEVPSSTSEGVRRRLVSSGSSSLGAEHVTRSSLSDVADDLFPLEE